MYDITEYRTYLKFQKSKRYLKYMKSKYPNQDLHHILGSIHSLKFTDYLIVPIDHAHHLNVVEPHKAVWFDRYFEDAMVHLQWWAYVELEIPYSENCKLLPNFEPQTVAKFIEYIYQTEGVKK